MKIFIEFDLLLKIKICKHLDEIHGPALYSFSQQLVSLVLHKVLKHREPVSPPLSKQNKSYLPAPSNLTI